MAKIYKDSHTVKDEWVKVKDQSLKVKAQWYWDYFGLLTVGVLLGILLLINVIMSVIENNVPKIVQGEIYIYNVDVETKADAFLEDFAGKLGYDPEDYRLDLTSSTLSTTDSEVLYAQTTKIIARVAAEDIDFFAGELSFLEDYIDQESFDDSMFANLKEILPEDLFEKLDSQGRIYYTTLESGLQYPVYIDMVGTAFYSFFDMSAEECYFAVVVNAPHLTETVALIEYYLAQ